MKQSRLLVSAIALSLSAGGVPLIGASPVLAASWQEVRAGVSDACTPSQGTFTVPGGQTATDFSIEHLSLGQNCYNHLPIDDGGFEISTGACPAQGGNVYWLSKRALSSESSRPKLDVLRVSPGTYCLSFNGGKNGGVRLRYQLVP